MVHRTNIALGILLALATGTASAQKPAQQPANPPANEGLNTPLPLAPATAQQPADSGLDNGTLPHAKDRAPESSPTAAPPTGTAVHIGTSVSVKMSAAVSSGSVRNGDSIHGTLATPLKTTSGKLLPTGTPVVGTVVSAAKAGVVQSGGVLSLQLTRVGSLHVITDVAEFDGQEGHKDVADSAPEKGSEAMVQSGAVLNFNVLENGAVPGLVKNAPPVNSKDTGIGTNPAPAASSPASGSTCTPNTAPGVNQQPINPKL